MVRTLKMNVALVASECFPFAKTGGLADVVGTLPKYLSALGVSVKVFIPKYDVIDDKQYGLRFAESIGEMKIRVGGIARSVYLYSSVLPGSAVDVYFIDCAEYFFRGKLYSENRDEDERFILFTKAVIESLQRLRWVPDVIHCNDWQTGLMPLLVKDNYAWDRMFASTAFLYSIHNIGYQGRFPEETLTTGELNRSYYYPGGPLEFDHSVSMMKAGIVFSEIISTVSNTYAHEILTPQFGAGLHDVLRARQTDLYGVLNGIDIDEWNPETDPLIPFHYSVNDLTNKEKNKEFLLKQTSIPYRDGVPVIGIISRLVSQKGFDLVADAMNELSELELQWVVLGSGEERFENVFSSFARFMPEKCWTHFGFNNELAHLIEAGADMFLMPSQYEPCGLNQMYSLRYGTVPIVRKTGGLADTVQDWHEFSHYGQEIGNGFSFNDATSSALVHAVRRAVDSYHLADEWKTIRINGMTRDNSWNNSARQYVTLYEKAIHQRNT
ncbi:MAG: glycogen/starch synthase, partial [Bacteroidota bacterium]